MQNHFFNIHLIALIFLSCLAFSLTGGSGNSLASALPAPSIPSTPVHHNIRHYKHRKMYFISNARPLDCPPNKVRGHDGDCYRAFRSRRSVGEVPKIDHCNQPGYVRDHFGGCSRVLNNRLRRSFSTFSQSIEQDVPRQVSHCPEGYTMNSDGFCIVSEPNNSLKPNSINLLEQDMGEHDTNNNESIDQHKVSIII